MTSIAFIEPLLPSEHDTFGLREALSKLAQCERHIKVEGACSIIGNFNIIYSCYNHINELKAETLDEILNTLIKGIIILESDLKRILTEKQPTDVRVKYLNTVKIFVFLIVEFSNFMEKKQCKDRDSEFMPIAGSKKTTKKSTKKNTGIDVSTYDGQDWNDTKEKVLDCIAKLVLLNIQKLWDPPIAEEQFVISITNLCYKFTENLQSNSLRPQQKKILKDHLCHILGLMIKKYNHSYGACVMIMQTLPHYEHFSSLYADLIHMCVMQLGYESILPDVLREFRHTNLTPGQSTIGSSKGNDQELKAYSQFLIELGNKLGTQLLPYLSLIQDLLDEDSYLMRNAIIHIFGEIIVKVLNSEATNSDLNKKQMRNELLDSLLEHIHDVNSFARTRTLQVWRRISDEKAIPLRHMNELMKRCIGRMEDNASTVRKSAFQLLCTLIQDNPYGIKSIEVSIDQLEAEFFKEEQALAQLEDEIEKLNEEASPPQTDNDMDTDSSSAAELNETIQETNTREVNLEERKEKHLQMLILQKSKVNYLKDTKVFIKQIESAIPMLSRLLFSKTQTDVIEVINFFVTCYEHGLVDMLFGIRKMLALVSYAEKTVKDAVINAYKKLYLTGTSSVAIAKQLIKLTQDLTICERDALEDLIGEFAISNELDSSVIKVFWEIFASQDQSAQYKLFSLIILGMVIKRIPEKGRLNIQVLIDYGLSFIVATATEPPTATSIATDNDMLRFSETCKVLSYISIDANTKHLLQQDVPSAKNSKSDKKSKRGSSNKENESLLDSSSLNGGAPHQARLQFFNEPFKLMNSCQLFERINDLILGQFNNFETIYWLPFVESAMQCMYKLADNPIVLTDTLMHKLMEKIPLINHLTNLNRLPPVPLFTEEPTEFAPSFASSAATATTTQSEDLLNVNSCLLSRFIGLVGIVATKLLVFLNQYVVCELKRRKLCREAGVNSGQASLGTSNGTSRKNKDTAKDKAKQRRMSIRMISKSFNTSPALSSENDSALEEEMGLHGAEAEDVELLFIETVINTRVAQSSRGSPSTLAQLLPMVVLILKDPSKYPDEQLQLHCSLTLVKLMLLSQKLCTENLQLLFTLMEKSTIENVRSQLILGVGDLVYRFPNALEPWTGHLYLPLRDTKSSDVRMNTIRVLSHLILKEMIKTRGQIYEIALCTIDKDTKIASLAKRFFSELSQRNNGLVIYNAMPDIISQLSGGGGALNGQKATENESDDEQADADRDDDNDDAPVDLNTPRTITEDNFRTVVTYLFTFIKKDKQCETLIEKLCHAFRLANTSERKCRDLVFCLSKIQLSESGIKKLKETFKWYSDKLTITAVYDTFKNSILKNARKLPTLKNETKMLIDELEKQIEEVKRKGVTDEGGEDAAGDNLDVDNNNDAHAQESENVPANPSPAKRSQKSTRQVAATRRSANTAVKANNQKNKKKSIAANFAKKKGKNKENSSSESSSSSAENEEEEDDSD